MIFDGFFWLIFDHNFLENSKNSKMPNFRYFSSSTQFQGIFNQNLPKNKKRENLEFSHYCDLAGFVMENWLYLNMQLTDFNFKTGLRKDIKFCCYVFNTWI